MRKLQPPIRGSLTQREGLQSTSWKVGVWALQLGVGGEGKQVAVWPCGTKLDIQTNDRRPEGGGTNIG